MNLNQIDIKNFILALFKRDDGERILLGAGAYDFKDSLQHFQANIIANDIIEKQGTDGQLLAGQVRRCQTQTFEGYIGDASTSRIDTEDYRRKFIQFFRTNHFYTVIYIMPNGDAIQRKNGYLVEAPSAPEQYQRFPEYSVGFQFEDLNYYTYSEDDQGEETYAQTVDILPEGNLTGGLVWDGDGVVWDYQGKHIAALKGDTYQVTTTGKNLFVNIPSGSNNGIDFTLNTDGTYNITGKATAQANKAVEITNLSQFTNGETYTLSATKPLPAGAQIMFEVLNGTTWVRHALGNFLNNSRQSITGALNLSGGDRIKLTLRVQSGYTVNIRNLGAQIEKSATTTSFEPYTGGAPAPSPDYPQPVQTATGNQTVFINGKNLIGATEESRVDRGVTMTKNADGTLTFSGTATATYFQITAQSVSDGIATATDCNIPAGEYTVWLTHSTNQFGVSLRLYYSSVSDDYKQVSVTKNSTSTTFTIDRPAVAFYIWGSGTTVNQSISETLGIQLEAGSTPTSFEAWRQQTYPLDLGAIELCKLGTAQDRIYKDGNDWKVEKNTGYATLTSSDTWITGTAGKAFGIARTTGPIAVLDTGVYSDFVYKTKCSYFNAAGGNEAIVGQSWGGNNYINFNFDGVGTDIQTWKNWLDAHDLRLYAPLTTPTTTTITDANLIAQLEAIDEALEAGGTITVTPAVGNRAAIITTTPSGNGGAVWDASGGHSTNTITVGGLFAVQPVWIIDGPAESPVMENITDGTSLSYIGVIPAGQTLVIDCTNQTAYLDGANVKNNVRGTWQSFSPGEVTIRYSGANVTQASTLKWNEVVG